MWQPSESLYVDGVLLDRRSSWIHLFVATWLREEIAPGELDTTVLREQYTCAMFYRYGDEAPDAVVRREIKRPVGWTARLYPARLLIDPDDVPF